MCHKLLWNFEADELTTDIEKKEEFDRKKDIMRKAALIWRMERKEPVPCG